MRSFGYKFLVFAGNAKANIERRYIEELLAYNIEGMIILSPTISSRELASYNIPVVGIEREDQLSPVSTPTTIWEASRLSASFGNPVRRPDPCKRGYSRLLPSSGRIHGFVGYLPKKLVSLTN